MAILKGITTQSGADTFTQFAIDTNLTADGKVGWVIKNMRGYYSNAEAVAVVDMDVNLILSTRITTVTTFDETEELGRINWAVANTGGVAVAYPIEMIKTLNPFSDRITVQPSLYMGVSSTGSAATNVIYWEIDYDFVKLTDIELLRLLVSGA